MDHFELLNSLRRYIYIIPIRQLIILTHFLLSSKAVVLFRTISRTTHFMAAKSRTYVYNEIYVCSCWTSVGTNDWRRFCGFIHTSPQHTKLANSCSNASYVLLYDWCKWNSFILRGYNKIGTERSGNWNVSMNDTYQIQQQPTIVWTYAWGIFH